MEKEGLQIDDKIKSWKIKDQPKHITLRIVIKEKENICVRVKWNRENKLNESK